MATIDSGAFERTALAAWVAIARHTGTGDIASADAVALLRNLRQAVFHGVPVVRLSEADLAEAVSAPPEKETDHVA